MKQRGLVGLNNRGCSSYDFSLVIQATDIVNLCIILQYLSKEFHFSITAVSRLLICNGH